MIVAGILVAAVVVAAGHSSDGLQGVPPISYQALWAAVLAALTALGIGLGVGCESNLQLNRQVIAYGFCDRVRRLCRLLPVFRDSELAIQVCELFGN